MTDHREEYRKKRTTGELKKELPPEVLAHQSITRLENGDTLTPVEIRLLREMVEHTSKYERKAAPAYNELIKNVRKKNRVAWGFKIRREYTQIEWEINPLIEFERLKDKVHEAVYDELSKRYRPPAYQMEKWIMKQIELQKDPMRGAPTIHDQVLDKLAKRYKRTPKQVERWLKMCQ